MSDILQDMADLLAKMDDGELEGDDLEPSTIYILLSRAVGEIERLRKTNRDLRIDVEDLRSDRDY